MVLKDPFTTASPVIATFSFTDLADGTGVIDFFGVASSDSTGDVRILNQVNTGTAVVSVAVTGTEVNFDLTPFNTPRDIKGTGYVLARMNVSSGTVTFTFKVKHFDGTTATTIGTGVSSGITTAVTFLIPIQLTNKHFNTGDILRLSLTSSGAGSIETTIANPLRLSTPFELPL